VLTVLLDVVVDAVAADLVVLGRERDAEPLGVVDEEGATLAREDGRHSEVKRREIAG
jgi:hypothetical protein